MKNLVGKIQYKLYQKRLEKMGLREVIIWSGSNKLASIGLE